MALKKEEIKTDEVTAEEIVDQYKEEQPEAQDDGEDLEIVKEEEE